MLTPSLYFQKDSLFIIARLSIEAVFVNLNEHYLQSRKDGLELKRRRGGGEGQMENL